MINIWQRRNVILLDDLLLLRGWGSGQRGAKAALYNPVKYFQKSFLL